MIGECPLVYDSQDESVWSTVDIDLISNMEADSKCNINNQKEIQTIDIPIPSLSVRYENQTHVTKGFTTASGKALKPVSEEAKKIALALFKDEECKEKMPAMMGFATASGKPLKPASKKAQKEALSLLEKTDDEINVDLNHLNGIKAASRRFLGRPSRANMEMTSKLFEKDNEMNTGQNLQGIKRPFNQSPDSEFKYENVLNKYGGFQMGNSKNNISISSNAKREAISMFENDSTVPNSPKSTSIVPEIASKQVVNNTPFNTSIKNDEKPSIPIQPKHSKRVKTIKKQNKPFKSPIIHSNIELTKAAINNKSNTKSKGQPVFNLTRKFHFKMYRSKPFISFFLYKPQDVDTSCHPLVNHYHTVNSN